MTGEARGVSPLARLLSEWARDAVLIGAVVLALMAARGALIASLWSHAGPQADAGGVLTALVRGFPFDLRTATVALLPTVVFSLTVLRWPWPRARRVLRTALGTTLLTGILLLTIVDHYYFREYASQFDHFVIGLVYDDTTAILRTVWNEHPVLWAALGTAAFAWGIAWLLARLARWTPEDRLARLRPALLASLIPVTLILLVCAARGSVSRLPAQSKNVAVTRDEKLLNKLVLNPIAALQGAIRDHREASAGAWRLEPLEVRAALHRLGAPGADADSVSGHFRRTARGADHPPRQVVLVVMESLSAWPLAERWKPFALTERTSGFAAEGVAVPRFLPESTGTMASLGPLLSGLPDCGIEQSYQPLARRPFATSLAPIFRRLGYRTRFFYSGYLSWQKLGDFVTAQGFDEIRGGGTISDWTDGNEWGVDDEKLLSYVRREQDDAMPTFDVVLTTSNHPPFSVDVYGKGFPWRSAPPGLPIDADADLRVLGHLWYSDRALGDFVDGLRRDHPGTLLAITGDHYGRRFPNRHPEPWERCAVPGVLLGPAVDGRRLAATAGSHLDLIPTLVELCAPAGFAYHALGADLFAVPQAEIATNAGALTTTGALEWNNRGDATLAPEEAKRLTQLKADRSLVSAWALLRGDELPPER